MRRFDQPTAARIPFYAGYLCEIVISHARALALLLVLSALYWKVRLGGRRHEYMDIALSPVEDEDGAGLELFSIPRSAPKTHVAAPQPIVALSDGA
jgi:hypothetical protein